MRIFGSMGALDARKPIERPSIAPCPQQRDELAPAREQAAEILARFQPDANRLGGVVLEQHRNSTDSTRGQRIGEGPAHDHVARLVNFAEQAGIALRAVGIDGGAWRENGRDRRFGM
jgi:hypothetical protein